MALLWRGRTFICGIGAGRRNALEGPYLLHSIIT
ncbi:23S rRNA (guanosine(2251)-2'-O)-methyltransferase RlmB, partial [Acetobacter sp. DmW_125123]